MDLPEIIADLESRLQKAETVAAEIPSLKRQLQSAREMASHYAPTLNLPDPSPPGSPGSNGVVTMTRGQAIVHVLSRSHKSMSPADIAEALHQAGRLNETSKSVSVALDRLRQRKQVRKVGYGAWRVV